MSGNFDTGAPPGPVPATTGGRAPERVAGYDNRHLRAEVLPGVFACGINDSRCALATLGLLRDLRGARVLDIGAR